MAGDDVRETQVRARAVLIDPASMTVLWTNEPDPEVAPPRGTPLVEAVPMAEMMGAPEVVRSVSETGVAGHMRTDLVSTGKGSVSMVTSVYRLPDGTVLMLTENTWVHGDRPEPGARRGPRGRTR